MLLKPLKTRPTIEESDDENSDNEEQDLNLDRQTS